MSKPAAEHIAAANLARQGYDYYLPLIKQQKPGKMAVIEPLFRRYLFVLTDGRWYTVRHTKGISHILLGEGVPRVVNPQVIAELKAREGPDGLVTLQRPPKYRRGQRVKVDHGPFAGHLALYDGMAAHERAWVLLQMLGAAVKVELEERILAAA